ncbi:hypothetical protein OM428_03170 [Enterococcus gallinarum]|nr:hypothetical protein [Enterococcus gallinarum]MCW3744263.1 hypothetical protein [Enterococcus gallinarum]
MKQSRGLFDLSYRLGDYLLMVIRLHFLWFFFVLRGNHFWLLSSDGYCYSLFL